MLGMWGVGKTSLVRKFVDNIFDEKYLSTIGVKVDKKPMSIDGREMTLVLWDIAGAEDKFGIPMHYIKGSAAYLLVIDGTRKESLETAIDLMKEIEEEIGLTEFVVVVNKSDLEWALSDADIDEHLGHHEWFRSSAKTGENVEAAFTALARKTLV